MNKRHIIKQVIIKLGMIFIQLHLWLWSVICKITNDKYYKNDYKKVTRINFLVEAKHKKPLIPWKGLRYASVLIMLGIITLALIGYMKSKEKLRLHNEQLIQQEKHTKSD